MNTRLEGWKLGLAVLVPAIIIAGAIWFAIQALSGDDNTSVDASGDDSLTPTVTATPLPVTDEVTEPTVVPTPTPLEVPTPLAIPSPTADTEPTATPAATPTRVPTGSGSGSGSGGSGSGGGGGGGGGGTGATPTPTTDPNLVTVACAGATFPITIDEGDSVSGLSAAVSPPDKAASMSFLWNFGNGRTVGAPNSGTVTYNTEGNYTVTLQATDATTGEVRNVTCGTVRVGSASASVRNVSCQVRPSSSAIKWADATINDLMRVTTTWRPTDTPLNLQYEFEINDPIQFSNGAESGDSLTRVFASRSSTVKVFWRNEATGETGRISCRAFPAEANATPTPYNAAVSG